MSGARSALPIKKKEVHLCQKSANKFFFKKNKKQQNNNLYVSK